MLGVYILDAHDRPVASRVAGAATILTREAAVLALLPLVWRAWRHDGWRGVARWAWVPLPYLAWAGWVRLRVGDWPFTDPAYSRTAAISGPFGGIAEVLRGSLANAEQLALLVGLATVLLALFVWRARAWFPVSTGALTCAAIVPFLGISVWSHLFEAARVLSLPLALATLALVGGGPAGGEEATEDADAPVSASSRRPPPPAPGGRSPAAPP